MTEPLQKSAINLLNTTQCLHIPESHTHFNTTQIRDTYFYNWEDK